MALRQLPQLIVYAGNRSREIVAVKAFQRAICGQRLIQIAQNARVIQNKAKLLWRGARVFVAFIVEPIHPRDGLQQRVFLELSREVEHRIARRVKAREQLAHHNQNLRLFAELKSVNDLLFVSVCIAVAFHHALPKRHDCIARFVRVHLVVALAFVRRGDHHFAGYFAKVVKVGFVFQRRYFRRRDQLRFETGALPVFAKVRADVEGAHVDHLIGFVEHFCAGEFLL